MNKKSFIKDNKTNIQANNSKKYLQMLANYNFYNIYYILNIYFKQQITTLYYQMNRIRSIISTKLVYSNISIKNLISNEYLLSSKIMRQQNKAKTLTLFDS